MAEPKSLAAFEMLDDLSWRLNTRGEPTAKIPDRSWNFERNDETPCVDCKKVHLRRRIVCCVDGISTTSDSATGDATGNLSNIFRIWASVKDGVVSSGEGNRWQQIRKYFEGIGFDHNPGLRALLNGTVSTVLEELIFRVYKYCALNCCPSRDEVYFFGYSTGAYVVRAVAALLYHLRTLDPRSEDFGQLYRDSLRIYRQSNRRDGPASNEAGRHRMTNTLPPIQVKFIGVIDTVRAYYGRELVYDISQTPNIIHVRHALALLEPRSYLPLELNHQTLEPQNNKNSPIGKSIPEPRLWEGHTCNEAWFLGTHRNLGGSLARDGLSLWPLQYLLSEAKTVGLNLEFKLPVESIEFPNPLEYAMPSSGKTISQVISYRNGITVRMWDLGNIFAKSSGFEPDVEKPWESRFERERHITNLLGEQNGGRINTIIHPSVYYHHDCTSLGLGYLKYMNTRRQIERYRNNITIPNAKLFWNKEFYQDVDITLQNPRVLVCGSHGSSKSTIINMVAKEKIAKENSTMKSTDHDIYKELQASQIEFRFHDSQGWDNGSNEPFMAVENFLKYCRSRPVFAKQLHCIWYCMEVSQTRINSIDKAFFNAVDPRGVTLILVFTKCDRLVSECHNEAVEEYERSNHCTGTLDPLSLPPELQAEITRLRGRIYEAKKASIARDVMIEIGQKLPCVFVSRLVSHAPEVEKLTLLTRASRHSPTLRRIYHHAIRSHLSTILQEACEFAANLRSQRLNLPSDGIKSERGHAKNKMPTNDITRIFGLRFAKNAHFEDLAQRLAVASRGEAFPLSQWGITIVSVALASYILAFLERPNILVALLVFGAIFASLTYIKYTGESYEFERANLVELALLILACDRMFWFDSQTISRGMALRASIRAGNLAADVKGRVHEELKMSNEAEYKGLLSRIVNELKFDGDHEN